MNNRKEQEQEESQQGLALGDIYYILFRQKWIILLCGIVGFIGAISLMITKPPVYQSECRLYIRYIVESESLTPPGDPEATRSLNNQEQSIIKTELEILRSFNLAHQVAEAVGAEKILAKAGGGSNVDQAAIVVMKNLAIESSVGSSVIPVVFQHPDRDIAQEVLTKVIDVYYSKHSEAHRPVRVMGEFLTQETARLHEELLKTEQQLRDIKRQAGVTSVEESKKAYTEQMSKIRMDLFDAEAELAGYQAILEQSTNMSFLKVDPTNTAVQIPPEKIEEYQRLRTRIAGFEKREDDLRFTYKTNNPLVQEIRAEINDLEKQKQKLELSYPQLTLLAGPSSALPGQPAANSMGVPVEAAHVEALKSKIQVLTSQLTKIRTEAANLDDVSSTILDLERKRDVQEAHIKYFTAKLEKANIDDALGTGKAPNISMIDPPTPRIKARPKGYKKKLMMVALGPVAVGLGLAFLIEMFLDSSVRRASDVQNKLRLPLFISIPVVKRNGHRKLVGGQAATTAVSVWEGANHPLRRFYEGLRDRLLVYFEVRNLTHKPKLVAVTSCDRGAGVSGVATGLAASLSETGDGHVLLVNMNPDQQGASQEFHKGNLCGGLEPALHPETKNGGMVQENLYVATERADDEKLPRVLPNRFKQMMPKLRASDYDYIIFDMPPISPTTVTPRMAGLMDMVLLVIESEKTSLGVVKQATALLSDSNAAVSVVLNKTRVYVPARLHQELSNI